MLQFSTDALAKHEIYRSFQALQRKYQRLININFFCLGSNSLTNIICEILDRILDRFHLYPDTLIKGLVGFLPALQEWFIALRDSVPSEVAWSIIPSLESLFSEIEINTQFVIAPTWKRTYEINTVNAFKELKEASCDIDGFLDETREGSRAFFNKLQEDNNNCENLFVLYYPRVKRLSATHFALFGHEIGHLIYPRWELDHIEDFKGDNQIENKISQSVIDYLDYLGIKTDSDIFDRENISLASQFTDNIFRALEEICCDIVGCIVFGYSFLFSIYKFSSVEDMKMQMLDEGYFPWAYRIKICLKSIDLLGEKYSCGQDKNVAQWIASIKEHISQLGNPNEYVENNIEYNYYMIIANAIDRSINDLVCQLNNYIESISFEKDFNYGNIRDVKYFLDKRVVPSAIIDKKFNYRPIKMRNIISGTWLHLITSNIDIDNTIGYYKYSRNSNLLALKGIELSKELNDFINRDMKHEE